METIQNLVVKVEGIVGTGIPELARSLVALADRWGVMVECDANGIQMIASPGMAAMEVARAYHRSLAARQS